MIAYLCTSNLFKVGENSMRIFEMVLHHISRETLHASRGRLKLSIQCFKRVNARKYNNGFEHRYDTLVNNQFIHCLNSCAKTAIGEVNIVTSMEAYYSKRQS